LNLQNLVILVYVNTSGSSVTEA